MTNHALFDLQNVSATRAKTPVLQAVSLRILEGETLVIIGQSGSGKTTLLRTLNRLDDIGAGQILFDGADILSLDVIALRREVGFVFQKTASLAGTVAENIAFAPRIRGETLSDDRIRELMQMASLELDLMHKPASELSGGQAQRMAIARALANQPRVLLLDEPTASLDPIATRQVEKTLKSLQIDLGLTLVWVSHEIAAARRVANRVLLLEGGRVVRVDDAAVMLHPQNGDPRALAFAAGEDGSGELES